MIDRFAGLFKFTETESNFLEGCQRLKLVVGLGNPGRVYDNSRHNLGFRCINRFARDQGIRFEKQRSKSRVGFGRVGGESVILAKPQTFMNLSGESVGPLVQYYRIGLEDLLVIYDDVDLPLGTLRIREKAGAAGHNGMKSIIQHLGSHAFPRIRVGIRPPEDTEITSPRTPEFVLGRFSHEERQIVERICSLAAEAIESVLVDGLSTSMNKYNSG